MTERSSLKAFCQTLGYQFNDSGLLARALQHASLDRADNNERLEFLGDRVLGVVIADALLTRYADEKEGALARRLSQLVSRKTCAKIARTWNLQSVLQVDKGAQEAMSDNILADGCEAVLGAVYLDAGLAAAEQIILAHWEAYFDAQSDVPIDHKTALQEFVMKRGEDLPAYEIIDRTGPDHAPEFNVRVSTQEAQAQATGKSRRLAEQLAAAACLAQLVAKE
jgi:ribonuclease-3